MTAVLIALNITAGLFLVAVVLLQAGKGADMGAAFGGANPAAFGPATQGNVLQKITAATAAIFMSSSLALAVLSARQESVFDGASEPPPLAAPVAIPGGTPPTDAAAVGEVPPSADAAPQGAAAVVDAAREGAAVVAQPSGEQPPAGSDAPAAAPQQAAPAGPQ